MKNKCYTAVRYLIWPKLPSLVAIITASLPYGHAPLSHSGYRRHHDSIPAFLSLVRSMLIFLFFFKSLLIASFHVLLAAPLDKQPPNVFTHCDLWLMRERLILFFINMKSECTNLNSRKMKLLKMNSLIFFLFLNTIND